MRGVGWMLRRRRSSRQIKAQRLLLRRCNLKRPALREALYVSLHGLIECARFNAEPRREIGIQDNRPAAQHMDRRTGLIGRFFCEGRRGHRLRSQIVISNLAGIAAPASGPEAPGLKSQNVISNAEDAIRRWLVLCFV